MPSGAKKRKAAKKKKGQLGTDQADPPTDYQGNGGGREEGLMSHDDKDSEAGDLPSPASGHASSPLAEEAEASAPVGQGEVSPPPLTATEDRPHSGVSVERVEPGKEMKNGGGGDDRSSSSSESSSSDEEPVAVEIPVLGEASNQAFDQSLAAPPTNDSSERVVSISGEMDVPRGFPLVETEASTEVFVDHIAVKAMPLAAELKGTNDNSSVHVISMVEEVERGPQIAESELVASLIPEKIVPSTETATVIDRHRDTEIRETPDNEIQGGSAPLPRPSTSWKCCCGLFELFGGAG